MPISNIKNTAEVAYMKINNIAGKNVKNTKDIRGANRKENVVNRNVTPKHTARTRNAETVQLASKKMVKNAVNKAMNMPEVREEKVAQIKAQVQQGTYNVSNSAIARSMIGNLLNEIA